MKSELSVLHRLLVLLVLLLLPSGAGLLADETDTGFQSWLRALIAEARDRGVPENLIQEVLVPVTPIPQVVSNDRNQAEFVETLDTYLEKRVTDWRISNGRTRLADNRETLAAVEAEYGVPAQIIVAIWGIETNYGNFSGGTDVIRALVTLAYDPRRSEFFRNELFAALDILAEGHVQPADMKGSWAGAMGQSQFMPSSFIQYAVDFDGDGRRDIWGTEADVFASIANYLRQAGWEAQQPWSREVLLPATYHERAEQWRQSNFQDTCSVLRHHTVQRSEHEWQAVGIRQLNGAELPATETLGSVVLPDGSEGRAFLAYNNFRAILRYNCANNYALAVAALAESF